MNNIKFYIYTIIGTVTGLVAFFFKAVNIGKEQQKAKQTKEVLNRVKKAKKLADSISDDERNRLRKKYHHK